MTFLVAVLFTVLCPCTGAIRGSICIERCFRNEQTFLNFKSNSICKECVRNPPLELPLCVFACRYPEKPYLHTIADKCASDLILTDKLCIVSCMSENFPYFNSICQRCRNSPPMTGDMCIFACDRTALLSQVCMKCKDFPPLSSKLCVHACQNKDTNVYYNRICYTCKRHFA